MNEMKAKTAAKERKDPACLTPMEKAKANTLQIIWQNLKNWHVEYLLIPLGFLSVLLLAKFAYFLTGRAPTENADALVGFAFRILDIAAIIIALSLTREATGTWWTKDDLKTYPHLSYTQTVKVIAFAIIYAYLLTH